MRPFSPPVPSSNALVVQCCQIDFRATYQPSEMQLFFDPDDLPHAKKLRDERFAWLRELGATPLDQAKPDDEGFFFGYQHGNDHLRRTSARFPNMRDRPEEREELIRLDHVLERLDAHGIEVPTPRTWILRIDDQPPRDLEFPLFVRTPSVVLEAWRATSEGKESQTASRRGGTLEAGFWVGRTYPRSPVARPRRGRNVDVR